MEENIIHHWHILLYYFKKGKRAAEAHRKICSVYGDDALTERTCQNWFVKFHSGNFDINDSQQSGRPQEIETNNFKAIVDQNPTQSVREIAMALNVSHTSVENHLQKFCFVSRLNV